MRELPLQTKESLAFDRKIITQDLRLKMPRITKKYMKAVSILSNLYFTSPYFIHLIAAEKGHKTIYNRVQKLSFHWCPKKKRWLK
jgi:hypothetical protein